VHVLRAVWEEPRAPGAPRRVWRDWVLVGVLALCGAVELAVRTDLRWWLLSAVLTLGLLPALLWRRSQPLLVLAVTFAVTGVAGHFTGTGSAETVTLAYLLILVYALYRWGSGRETVLGSAVVLVGLAAPFVRGRLDASELVAGAAVVLAASTLGATMRTRARARFRDLESARLQERERIARDLHDTVAHHVSAVVIRAQVGLAADSRTGAQRDALEIVEAEAGRALEEMRGMLRLLRRGEAVELAPARGIGDVRTLAERPRDGLAVEVAVELDDESSVAPAVAAAVFRIVQESITNARRHARGATVVSVRVAGDDSDVRVRVADDGHPVAVVPAGLGITGMVERAALLGGTCTAGPASDGGWLVVAVLPRQVRP